MLTLERIEKEHAPEVTPFMERYITRALAHDNGEGTLDAVLNDIHNGILTLWVVFNGPEKHLCGCVVTGFIKYPKKLAMELLTVTVDAPRNEWMGLNAPLEEYAREHGCKNIEFIGRMGLAKITLQAGFKKTHIKMTKEL